MERIEHYRQDKNGFITRYNVRLLFLRLEDSIPIFSQSNPQNLVVVYVENTKQLLKNRISEFNLDLTNQNEKKNLII